MDSVHGANDIEVAEAVEELEHLGTITDTDANNIEVVIDNQQIAAVLEPESKRIKLTTASLTLPEPADTLGMWPLFCSLIFLKFN